MILFLSSCFCSLSTQLLEQQQTIAMLRAQLDTLASDKSALGKERVELKKALEVCFIIRLFDLIMCTDTFPVSLHVVRFLHD